MRDATLAYKNDTPYAISRLRLIAAMSLALIASACFFLLATFAPAAQATQQTFDLNAAIANASDGQTLTVPAGVHVGPFVIDRPLTLVAESGAILDGQGTGDVIQINSPHVTVRGFVIRNTGDILDRENSGIVVTNAGHVIIEDCTLRDVLFGIYLKNSPNSIVRRNTITSKPLGLARRGDCIRVWASDNTTVNDNTVNDGRDVVLWYSENLVVQRNIVTDSRYGLHFMYAANATVEDNRLIHNSVGVFLMYTKNLIMRRNVMARNRGPSGFGIGIKDVDGADIRDNLLIDNRVGIHIDNSPSNIDLTHRFQGNILAYNDIGLGFMPNVTRNEFTQNAFCDNVQQIAVFGGGKFEGNRFTIEGKGNYWGDYRGFDFDGDGIGDMEHRAASVFENLMDRQPKLRLFLFSPAQQAIGSAAKAFPIVKPKVRAVDTAPLMHPPRPASIAPPQHHNAASLWLASALMLGSGAGVLFTGWRGF
ncbi:MAG: nitrous oxide reductase family maturation protein NosD [Algisphaera sp.]